jgi:hypothetical protein
VLRETRSVGRGKKCWGRQEVLGEARSVGRGKKCRGSQSVLVEAMLESLLGGAYILTCC